MAIETPTIVELQSQGFVGFYVTCTNPMCLYSTPIRFESLMLEPSTPVRLIEKMRRFECVACGCLQVSTMPECVFPKLLETRMLYPLDAPGSRSQPEAHSQNH